MLAAKSQFPRSPHSILYLSHESKNLVGITKNQKLNTAPLHWLSPRPYILAICDCMDRINLFSSKNELLFMCWISVAFLNCCKWMRSQAY